MYVHVCVCLSAYACVSARVCLYVYVCVPMRAYVCLRAPVLPGKTKILSGIFWVAGRFFGSFAVPFPSPDSGTGTWDALIWRREERFQNPTPKMGPSSATFFGHARCTLLYVYVYAYVRVYVCVCVHVCVCLDVRACVRVCMRAHSLSCTTRAIVSQF